MEDERILNTVRRISLSELLHFSTPVSGASSIFPSSTSPPSNKNFNELPPKPRNLTFFTPFRTHVILSGTISLSSSHRNSCIDHCFSFSDSGSTIVCCSLLDLKHNLSNFANNQQIRVLAWNFLPFDHQDKIHHDGRGGILEIIRWEWVEANADLVDHAHDGLSVAKLTGVLKSISPTFAVPYKKGGGDSAVGFLAEVVTLNNISNYVYFIKPCYKWRAAMNMLVGKVVVVSGLKKKLICVGGGNTSYEIFVTLNNCMVSLCEIPFVNKPNWVDLVRVYNGVVTGVYMRGMAVELDNKVWLSVANMRLAPPHSVRVGAVISIMNFHIIDPKYSWIKMPILCTCARTSIKVLSFSLIDARSYVRTDNQSMLGKFIESLTLPAKFWMLLLVSCFRRKFSNIYSDKEILGSKKHEGMAQLYASRYLGAHHFQPQNGIFKEFCKHEHYNCEAQSNMSDLKLVGPISSFICKCETLWMSLLQKQTRRRKRLATKASNDVTASCNTIRKIMSSKDLGFILMGSLKMSTLGRLQLVDATGSIDVVIPDLLPNINGEDIYEVRNYELVLEGSPSEQNDTKIHFMEAFSFRNIFELLPLKKALHKLVIYVVFYLTSSTCLSATFRLTSLKPADNILNSANEITPLFLVTHKFSTVENADTKFKGTSSLGNTLKSCSYILYAEAIVLPYKLFFKERKLADRSEELTYTDKMNFSKIACQLRSKRFDCKLSFVPGFLCYTKNSICQDVRILLEFKFDSFFKYEALQIGHCYILSSSYKEHRAMVLRNTCSRGRVLITPQIDILSVSFCFDEFMDIKKPFEDSMCVPPSLGTSFSCEKDKPESNIILKQSHSQVHSNSDVQIHLSTVEKDLLSRIFSKCAEVLSVLSCYQLLKSKVGMSLNFSDSKGKDLPRGNLISVRGNIENMQILHCDETTELCHPQRIACEFVIHLNDGPHRVQVDGYMKAAHPLGFGPGANVTFHRVLLTCQANGCHRLVLTPVSFVVINSVKEHDQRYFNKGFTSRSRFRTSVEEASDIVTLGMFSQLNQCMEGKLYRFRCRVKTICIIVLDLHGISSESQSMVQLNNHAVNINLAGFILDDGSSLSCCWASGSRAERLLSFSEICQRPFFSSHNSTRTNECNSSRDTVGHHMEKMLKKHHRVIIKNNGSAHESATLGVSFTSEAEEVFSCSEEKLIRLVIHSACNGSDFSIVGDVMDLNSLRLLNEEHQSLHVPFQNISNVWIKQAEIINSLIEARSILHELRG